MKREKLITAEEFARMPNEGSELVEGKVVRKGAGPLDEGTITAEEFARMPNDHCELVDGKIIRMSPAGRTHGKIAARIHRALDRFVERHDLGHVIGSETGYRTKRHPDGVRAPDVAFVSHATDACAEESEETFYPVAPDLAVEVLSPDDGWEYVETKVKEYLKTGSKVVWVVSPKNETVHVYERKRTPRILEGNDSVDGGRALPGFKAKVSAFFTDKSPRSGKRQ